MKFFETYKCKTYVALEGGIYSTQQIYPITNLDYIVQYCSQPQCDNKFTRMDIFIIIECLKNDEKSSRITYH